ncbi:TPA: hypothetical protein MNC29_005098 [Citrobacter freundii]|uniref:hypothetical protein n=1 Tax=Citrobacter freundii TaxID=546 RepID=UPI001BD054FF|nr:hypothetical protein [Citrobacter freundii]EIN8656649.1 hypothetical protein [Citrobacter freundii]HBZ9067943.1 hypothetical protein [Citrobacter freundii]HBZ9266766.1 hypothetical protein [Citrobacter freundii]HBZ9383534.1 hypothetical protein [Citrobacter freundii]HBZ9647261.1 hypothetical protein [Citrobacter freundii]
MRSQNYIITSTNEFNEKTAYVDSDGDLVIEHDEQSVIIDVEQARQLIAILEKFTEGAAQ